MNIPIINLEKTGDNIRRLRKRKGVTVERVRSLIGFTNPNAIYKWERGECLPTLDNLVALAYILGVSIDEIISTEGASR